MGLKALTMNNPAINTSDVRNVTVYPGAEVELGKFSGRLVVLLNKSYSLSVAGVYTSVFDMGNIINYSVISSSVFWNEELKVTENFKALMDIYGIEIKPLYGNDLPCDHIYNVFENIRRNSHSMLNLPQYDQGKAFLEEFLEQVKWENFKNPRSDVIGLMGFEDSDFEDKKLIKAELEGIEAAFAAGNKFKQILVLLKTEENYYRFDDFLTEINWSPELRPFICGAVKEGGTNDTPWEELFSPTLNKLLDTQKVLPSTANFMLKIHKESLNKRVRQLSLSVLLKINELFAAKLSESSSNDPYFELKILLLDPRYTCVDMAYNFMRLSKVCDLSRVNNSLLKNFIIKVRENNNPYKKDYPSRLRDFVADQLECIIKGTFNHLQVKHNLSEELTKLLLEAVTKDVKDYGDVFTIIEFLIINGADPSQITSEHRSLLRANVINENTEWNRTCNRKEADDEQIKSILERFEAALELPNRFKDI